MGKNNVRTLRERHQVHQKVGITAAHLARAARISRSYMTKIENGDATPSLKVAADIARYLGRPIEEVFDLDDEDGKRVPRHK